MEQRATERESCFKKRPISEIVQFDNGSAIENASLPSSVF